jgi:hypothetical protein
MPKSRDVARELKGIWNLLMVVVAVGCLIMGLYFNPLVPIPNGPNSPVPTVVKTVLDLPTNLTTPYPGTSYVTLQLTGGDAVVGVPLLATVYFVVPPSVLNQTATIGVEPDNAIIPSASLNAYSIPVTADFVLKPVSTIKSPNMTIASFPSGYWIWEGSLIIQYQVEGVFGASFLFYHEKQSSVNGVFVPMSKPPFLTLHTAPFIPIGNSFITFEKRNAALTNSLSFFVLFFAAVQMRIKRD